MVTGSKSQIRGPQERHRNRQGAIRHQVNRLVDGFNNRREKEDLAIPLLEGQSVPRYDGR